MKLRLYQREGISKIFEAWRNGARSVLFQMPTGTGKTVLFSEIVKKGHDCGRKILIIAHRKELIEQIVAKLRVKGVEAGIILAGEKTDYTKFVQVASIQTLTRRRHPEAHLVIIDECHHTKAKSYKKLWELYPEAKFLGVTATPIRLSGEGFDDLFDILVPSMQIKGFIRQEYLSPIKHFVGATPDLKQVKRRRGDYVTDALSRVMLGNDLMANLLDSYRKHAFGKSMIVFAVDVEHSKRIAERYQQAGIPAAHVDGTTPKPERTELLAHFKAGELKVVSNVEIITEGFDFPECEAVQLARPTKSLGLYLQMVGRVMRKAEGKKYGIVLDNAGLWLEHGLPTIDREWSLEATKGRNAVEKSNSTPVIALNEDGIIQEVKREAPQEMEGLELLEFSEEMQRLLVFELLLQQTRERGYKLLSAYYRYINYLTSLAIRISQIEFDYIKIRLNTLNSSAQQNRQFKKGFWFIQERTLGYRYRPQRQIPGIFQHLGNILQREPMAA